MAVRRPRESGQVIVAELGRPETPEETAERKAENSRKHRANQTLINLVYSLVASLAVVFLLVLVVVRPDPPAREPIDFAAVAEQSQPGIDEPLTVPALPPGWSANSAEVREGADGVTSWYVGFITPSEQFIAFSQGIDANATWVATILEGGPVTGSERVDGVTWDTYDARDGNGDGDNPGNLAFAMVTSAGASTWVLYGTADANEFRTIAASLSVEVLAAQQAGTESETTP